MKNDMLEIKPNCEHCGCLLQNEGEHAMICSFECTFCKSCVEGLLENVCPNCGGGFEKRPTRPTTFLQKYPPVGKILPRPVNLEDFTKPKSRNRDLDPRKR